MGHVEAEINCEARTFWITILIIDQDRRDQVGPTSPIRCITAYIANIPYMCPQIDTALCRSASVPASR